MVSWPPSATSHAAPFFAALTRTSVHDVRGRGFSVLVADHKSRDDVEAVHLRSFCGNRLAGLIMRGAYGSTNLDEVLRMQRRGVAGVEVNGLIPSSPLPHVMLGSVGAVDAGVAHLMAHGHRRNAALSSRHPSLNADERVLCFPAALIVRGSVGRPGRRSRQLSEATRGIETQT